MPDSQPIDDLIARLERERAEADRLYNDALTALDGAIQTSPALPDPPALYDRSRLPAINDRWNILPAGAPPLDRSIKGRLRAFVWRLIGPPLESQRQFNAAVADHLNRNAPGHEERSRALVSLLERVRSELAALVRFESLLVQYLQTITLYVDSKNRSLGGSELRERLALTEQRLLTLKRAVEQGESASRVSGGAAPAESRFERDAGRAPAQPQTAFAGAVDSLTYVSFEDRFRGSAADIRSRVEEYVPLFAGVPDVVDVGCGRGELLALLRERGVGARGVDVNPAMVDLCRANGFLVEQGDAVSYLDRQADGSIGGLIAIQVVEHFTPAYLLRFLETAFHKMRHSAPLVLETINPACWMAFFETYIRDVTHEQPLHPDTLRHLVQASGFSQVDVQFRRPVRESDRLDRIDGDFREQPEIKRLAAALNAHADKLNARLFSCMDYVVIARR